MPEKKAKKQKLTVGREELGEALHTALRKCCDSHPTSLLWNLLYLIDEGVWDLYLDCVWIGLQVEGGRKDGDPCLWKALKEASLKFGGLRGYAGEHGERGRLDWNSVHCLDITFGMLDEQDWQGFSAFLSY